MGESVSETSLCSLNESIPEQDSVRSEVSDPGAKLSFFFLWLFTAVIYARPEDIFPFLGQLHLTLLFGLCSTLTFLGALIRGSTRLLWTSELRIVLLLTGWYIAGVPFALWKSGSLHALIDVWFKTLLVFFLLTQTLVTVDRIRKLLWAVILSEVGVTFFSIVGSSKVVWVGERMQGVNRGILAWNVLGIAAAVTIPYIAAIFVAHRSILKTSLLAAAVLSMTWMLVLTASRGGFLNVLFSVGLTWLLVLRGSSRGRIAGVGIALALAVAISFAPKVFWDRLGTVWSASDVSANHEVSSARESKEDRLGALNRSIQYTVENPILGLGIGNFPLASATDLGRPEAWMGAHNTFTEISSEAGIPALLLFLALLVTTLRNMKRISNLLPGDTESAELILVGRATLASLLSFTFGAFFAHLAYEYYFFYLVAIACGIQQIALTTRVTSDMLADNLASEPQISAANWDS
jgi:O-antigen ligase